jgi:hypothetical protein
MVGQDSLLQVDGGGGWEEDQPGTCSGQSYEPRRTRRLTCSSRSHTTRCFCVNPVGASRCGPLTCICWPVLSSDGSASTASVSISPIRVPVLSREAGPARFRSPMSSVRVPVLTSDCGLLSGAAAASRCFTPAVFPCCTPSSSESSSSSSDAADDATDDVRPAFRTPAAWPALSVPFF